MPITLTEPIARAAAQDAANRQMRAAGRTSWSLEDYNLACETLERLWPTEDIMRGLQTLAEKIGRARFYISLKGDGISSGFYAESQTRVDAKREAQAHKAKYPCWLSAAVREVSR